jgi:hypothetical protein
MSYYQGMPTRLIQASLLTIPTSSCCRDILAPTTVQGGATARNLVSHIECTINARSNKEDRWSSLESKIKQLLLLFFFVIPMHACMYRNIVSDVQLKKAVRPRQRSCKTIACKYKGEANAKRLSKLQHKK